MRLLALGASVTQQSRHHETKVLTGYVEAIRELRHRTGHTRLDRVSYGGNRASDAGLVLMAEVVAAQPDVVLFEANVESQRRGRPLARNEMAWLYRQMLDAGALPITVFLTDPDQPDPTKRQNYQVLAPFCADHNLPMIVVDLQKDGPLEGHFRGVHTLEPGARLLAERIVEQMGQFDLSPEGRAALRAKVRPMTSDVVVAEIEGSLTATQTGNAVIVPPGDWGHVRIVQRHWVGPWSPILDVRLGDRPTQSVSFLDPACHYERKTFVQVYEGAAQPGDTLTMAINPTAPDYSICDRPLDPCPLADRKISPLSSLWIIKSVELAG